MYRSTLEKITNVIRDSFNSNDIDCEVIAKAVLQALKSPSKKLREGVMQSSLDCVPINHCEEQALKVWKNTINAILAGE